MDEVEGRFEVHADDGIPLLFGHAKHEAVLGDAGIVDEDVDGAEVFLHLLHQGFRFREVGGVRSVALTFNTEGFDLSLCLFVDSEIGECDVSAFGGVTEGDGLANASCCTCDECSLSFQ